MIRFYNGRVLSFAGGLKISDAEVWTDGGVITHVGAAKEDMPAEALCKRLVKMSIEGGSNDNISCIVIKL